MITRMQRVPRTLSSFGTIQIRFASAVPQKDPPPAAVSTSPTHPVNGPLTTLPPPLNTPTRSPSLPAWKYYFRYGRAFLSFYKAGGKAIYTNYKLAQAVSKRLTPYKGSAEEAAKAKAITRSDFQLLRRNAHDMRRVPMFGLTFVILGEWTALIVFAVSEVVPWTCRFPKQIARDRKIIESRRAISFSNLKAPIAPDDSVDRLGREHLVHMAWSLGLSARIWDYIFPGRLPGLPTPLLRYRANKRLNYLAVDDALISQAGGVGDMSIEEVQMACVERGINVLDQEEKDQRKALKTWIRRRKDVRAEYLLCTQEWQKKQGL